MTVDALIAELQKCPKGTVVCGDDRTTTYQIDKVYFAAYENQTVLELRWLPDNVDPT